MSKDDKEGLERAGRHHTALVHLARHELGSSTAHGTYSLEARVANDAPERVQNAKHEGNRGYDG